MRIALIVAAAENGVIGRDNQLPWHLPKDLQYFKRVTMGKPIIMGRKTFDSIGRPLPGRTNIVVTRQADWRADGVRVAGDLDEALAMAGEVAATDGVEEVMVIGGAQIYLEAFPRAERLYLTRVHAEVEGDARFPEIPEAQWYQVNKEDCFAEGDNPYNYSFVTLERVSAGER